MEIFAKPVEVRWADLDPNFHVRHSVYYDWGATVRLGFLFENGLNAAVMAEHHVGPILFREECIFRREVAYGDRVTVTVQLVKCRADMSRWSMRHEIWKNGDTLAATINVDGAWMDTKLRKLAIPPDLVRDIFDRIPKAPDFHTEAAP